MKTAVYMRVSTADQSISMQEREILQFLQFKGITDYEIYQDEGVSGSTTARNGLHALRKALQTHSISLVVVWRLDRLGRSLVDLISLIDEFAKQGAQFASVRESIDMSTPAGTLLMQLLGAFAEFERNIIIERTKSGLVNAKVRGIELGRPKIHGSAITSEVLALRSQGHSYSHIAGALNLSKSTISRICNKLNTNLSK